MRQPHHADAYASADADLDIVLQSIDESTKKHIVLIGDDTDLLVLLLYRFGLNNITDMPIESAKGRTILLMGSFQSLKESPIAQ